MKIETHADNTSVRAVFEGNIDLRSLDDVRTTLKQMSDLDCPKLILDLENVGFIDSAGLGVLVSFRKAQKSKMVVLANVNERIRKLIEITRLDSIFTLE